MTSTRQEMPLVEVRIPTYRRPEMLSEALQSLISQTHGHWVARVFDDSPEREAEAVVSGLRDSRISYVQNPRRLGAAGNLNQCFATGALFSEASHACCLEDDNLLAPAFMAKNLAVLERTGLSILMRNQAIFRREDGRRHVTTASTTLDPWFHQSRAYTPLELHARTFFYTGVSNGGLFWSTCAKSSLQDPSNVVDPSLQEYIRCWQIREDVYVDLFPLASYWEPCGSTERHYTTDRSFSRGIQDAHLQLATLHGPELTRCVLQLGAEFDCESTAIVGLSNLGNLTILLQMVQSSHRPAVAYVLRGMVKRLLVPSPILHRC